MRPTISQIQELVCARFGIRMLDMESRRRARRVARPRQIAMFLAYDLTVASLPMVGRHFGDRDHTTVLHAVKTVEQLMAQDRDFAAVVSELRQQLEQPEQPVLPQISPAQIASAQFVRRLVA